MAPPKNTNKLTPFVKRVVNSLSTIKMHDWHQRMLSQSNQVKFAIVKRQIYYFCVELIAYIFCTNLILEKFVLQSTSNK